MTIRPDGHDSPTSIVGEFRGLPALHLRSGDGANATLLLHGAHLVAWCPPGLGEQLYLSPSAVFDGRAAIRGGVPVIFPQFDRNGDLPRHGFARTRSWQPLSLVQGERHALAVLRLVDDAASFALWPQRFIAELSVHIAGSRLDIELAIEHRDGASDGNGSDDNGNTPDPAPVEPLRFTAALHTYLRVDDAALASIDGLHRLRYFDKVRATEQIDAASRLRADGELDRIYFDVAKPLVLHDGGRVVDISSHGFPDAVIWNPGPERAVQLDDLPDDGWREMLCVEAAAIGTPVVVPAGECWVGRQTIEIRNDVGEQPLAPD